jgi:hypothetical protein
MAFANNNSFIFEHITMQLDQKTLDLLSQVCRDACGRIRMKYCYNYAYCAPPFGVSWWNLAEDTGTKIEKLNVE